MGATTDWIDVKVRKGRKVGRYLGTVCRLEDWLPFTAEVFWSGDSWFFSDSLDLVSDRNCRVTHYAPLPEPARTQEPSNA